MADETPVQGESEEAELRAAALGDSAGWQRLMDRYRDRLRRMVQYRLHERVKPRVDASDVVQEAFLDAAKRLPAFLDKQEVPFFIWMRALVQQRLGMAHRDHLGRAKRSVAREAEAPDVGFDSSQAIVTAILDCQPSPSDQFHRKDMGEKLRREL